MLTDSVPSCLYRHEYYRRILCNWIGAKVKTAVSADMKMLGQLVEDICYNNAVRYFGFTIKGDEKHEKCGGV